MDDQLRNKNERIYDTIQRCIGASCDREGDDKFDRIVIVAMAADGKTLHMFSNANSDPEMYGILTEALNTDDEDEEDEDEEITTVSIPRGGGQNIDTIADPQPLIEEMPVTR